MKRIDRRRPGKPFGSPRWMVLVAVVGSASALWLTTAPSAGQRFEAPASTASAPADAGVPPGRAEAIEPHTQAQVEHIATLPDEEQPPTS